MNALRCIRFMEPRQISRLRPESPFADLKAGGFRSALYPRLQARKRASGSKDDPKDADLLLDLLTQHRDRLRRLDPDTEETRKLQLLVEAYGPQAATAGPIAVPT